MKQIFIYSLLVVLSFLGSYFSGGRLEKAVEISLWISIAGILFIAVKYSGKYLTGTYRSAVILIVIIGSTGILLASYKAIDNAYKQKEGLLTIGGQISEGEFLWNLKEISIKTLKEYYGGNKKNLEETFSSLYPPTIEDSRAIEILYNNQDSSKAAGYIYVDTLEANKITLICQSKFYKGINEDFVNFRKDKGMVQVKMRLTEKGGYYEIQN